MERGVVVLEYWRYSYKRMPRPIRRLLWWWLLPIGWMVVMSGLVAWRLNSPWRTSVWFMVADPVGMFAGQFIAICIVCYKTRKVRRDFVASGGRLCTQCGHSLAGLPDQGHCPECGERFDIDLDRLAWKHAGIDLKKAR